MEAYKDEYFEFFNDEDEMIQKIKTGDYYPGKVSKIKLFPLPPTPVTAHIVKEDFNIEASPDVIRDTMAHSRLIAEVTVKGKEGDETKNLLLRDTALLSLLRRARISGSSFSRMTPDEKANVLNLCLQKWPRAKALVYIENEKISAVLSGSKFRPLPQEKLLSVLKDVLNTSYKGYKYLGAYHDHSITTVDYELPANCNTIMETYKEALKEATAGEISNLSLAIQFITSDIGQRKATIHCYILKNGRRIPLGFVNGVDHMNKATIEDFAFAAGNIFSAMQKNVENIKKLLDIKLVYPENAMEAAAKEVGLPKVPAMEAIKMFADVNCGKPATAHMAFYALNETLYLIHPQPTGIKKLLLEDNVAKLLHFKWKSHDTALSIKW